MDPLDPLAVRYNDLVPQDQGRVVPVPFRLDPTVSRIDVESYLDFLFSLCASLDISLDVGIMGDYRILTLRGKTPGFALARAGIPATGPALWTLLDPFQFSSLQVQTEGTRDEGVFAFEGRLTETVHNRVLCDMILQAQVRKYHTPGTWPPQVLFSIPDVRYRQVPGPNLDYQPVAVQIHPPRQRLDAWGGDWEVGFQAYMEGNHCLPLPGQSPVPTRFIPVEEPLPSPSPPVPTGPILVDAREHQFWTKVYDQSHSSSRYGTIIRWGRASYYLISPSFSTVRPWLLAFSPEEKTALDLLWSTLTPDQQQEYMTHGAFTVQVKDGWGTAVVASPFTSPYSSYNVTAIVRPWTNLTMAGQKTNHCVIFPPPGGGYNSQYELPWPDRLFSQMLLLDADPRLFFETANVS